MTVPDLHIITFAVPYPAHYGGAIDVWNRLKALSSSGVKIHLHCFTYKAFKPQHQLQAVAIQVQYYPRVVWPALLANGLPYIISSRKNNNLLNQLMLDDCPVLFDGIHTTGFATELKERKLLLRAHNIEHQYYAEIAEHTQGLRSVLYKKESQRLKDYEQIIAKYFDQVFAISTSDQSWFVEHGASSVFMPPFHGIDKVEIQTGRGQYLLYQGDLSLVINQNAVLDMMQHLPADQSFPVVVAGKSGNRSFEEKIKQFSNLTREADVSQEKMIELIQKAHIVLIPGLHSSGMKLKIFPALFNGKFVAASLSCKTNTILDQAIHFFEFSSLGNLVNQLWPADFTPELLRTRKEILAQHPNDLDKAKEIMRYL